jgi:hypothetical protein
MDREPKASSVQQDDPSTIPIVVIGLVGALLVLLMVIVLETLYYAAQRQEEYRKMVAPPAEELSHLRADQQERLNSYRWVDQAKGVVAIPIERAMELETRSLNAAAGGRER